MTVRFVVAIRQVQYPGCTIPWFPILQLPFINEYSPLSIVQLNSIDLGLSDAFLPVILLFSEVSHLEGRNLLNLKDVF
jgi:hypothetical protein